MKRSACILLLLLMLAGCDRWASITIHVIDPVDNPLEGENPLEGIAVNYAFEDSDFREEITDEDGCVYPFEIVNPFDDSTYFTWKIRIEDDRYEYYYYEGKLEDMSDFYITLTEALKNK